MHRMKDQINILLVKPKEKIIHCFIKYYDIFKEQKNN